MDEGSVRGGEVVEEPFGPFAAEAGLFRGGESVFNADIRGSGSANRDGASANGSSSARGSGAW